MCTQIFTYHKVEGALLSRDLGGWVCRRESPEREKDREFRHNMKTSLGRSLEKRLWVRESFPGFLIIPMVKEAGSSTFL